MINLSSNEAKKRYHRQFILSTINLERYSMNIIAPILGRCFLDAARLLEFGITNSDSVITNNKDRLKKALLNTYRRTGIVFSDQAFDEFEKTFGKTYAEVPLTRGMKEDYWGSFGLWSNKVAAKKIVKINNTTRESIRLVLQKGQMDGKSYGMIAKDLRNVSPTINKQRAYRIARTEIHTAAVFSTDESFRHTRVEFEREWHSTIDQRTRGLNIKDLFSHVIANGETVSQDGKFIRTGEALSYPGDPDGSAANIINCRCILLYHALKRVIKPIKKPVVKPLTQEYQFTDNIDNSKDQIINKLGIAEKVGFESFKSKKRQLEMINKTGEVLGDIETRFPRIYNLIKRNKKLTSLDLKESLTVRRNALGYYKRIPSLKQNSIKIGCKYKGIYTENLGYKISTKLNKVQHTVSNYQGVLRHEFGHHVHMTLLSQTDRDKWDRFWIKQGKNIPAFWSNNVSFYASTNVKEGFAETFNIYTNPNYGQKNSPKLSKDIENIMKDLIGRVT